MCPQHSISDPYLSRTCYFLHPIPCSIFTAQGISRVLFYIAHFRRTQAAGKLNPLSFDDVTSCVATWPIAGALWYDPGVWQETKAEPVIFSLRHFCVAAQPQNNWSIVEWSQSLASSERNGRLYSLLLMTSLPMWLPSLKTTGILWNDPGVWCLVREMEGWSHYFSCHFLFGCPASLLEHCGVIPEYGV